MNKQTVLSCCFALMVGSLTAQVALDLSYDVETEIFTVSAVSQETYYYPDNTTATAQVTLTAPTGTWEMLTFQNATGAQFELNSRTNAPDENPAVDYISFGLNNGGTDAIPYVANEPAVLFTFTLADPCAGRVALVNNDNDPFLPPNSALVNIGNDLAVMGAALYGPVGLTDNWEVDCGQTTTSDETPELAVATLRVFPNPVVELVNVELNWDEPTQRVELQTVDATGKTVFTERTKLTRGKHILTQNACSLAPGMYFLRLVTADGDVVRLGSFVRS